MSIAASLMLVVLFRSACTTSELTPWDFLIWSLSCSVYMYNIVSWTFRWRVKCVLRAMRVKVGAPGLSLQEYIWMANKYPEFGLENEKAYAHSALQRHLRRTDWHSYRSRTLNGDNLANLV